MPVCANKKAQICFFVHLFHRDTNFADLQILFCVTASRQFSWENAVGRDTRLEWTAWFAYDSASFVKWYLKFEFVKNSLWETYLVCLASVKECKKDFSCNILFF
jgi:hypothetical protein